MSETVKGSVLTNEVIGFVGLGQMGLPMASRLVAAGFQVRGHDAAVAARNAFKAVGGAVFETAREAAAGATTIITMLPNGGIVRDVLLGADGVASVLSPGSLIIDMSSSAPAGTRELAATLVNRHIDLIDAPVSGGVPRAVIGTLAIIAGGRPSDVERARPILEAMGKSIVLTGSVGSGHAMKALNNYVSAAGLAAACEAVIVGREFGLAPEIVVEVLNVSTGRNNSTDLKMKPFILSGTFRSGFSMALMAKDIRTAAELAEQLGVAVPGLEQTAELWDKAAATLGKSADHTEIFRYLAREDHAKD